MPKSLQTKEKTRQKILKAAGRGFRTGGYGGIGVDGIAKDAGVTSGAFYAHFGSKANAFEQAIVDGLVTIRTQMEAHKDDHGERWIEYFINFYFGDQLKGNLCDSCTISGLSIDVARAKDETKLAYADELKKIADTLAPDLYGTCKGDIGKAWALLGVFAGGANMARAVDDPKLAEQITEAVKSQAREIAGL